MKKVVIVFLMFALLLTVSACGQKPAESTAEEITVDTQSEKPLLRVMSLKGPTSMGLIKLLEDKDKGLTENRYEMTMVTAADEITASLLTGKTDIAFLPANAAATLYNKAGGIKIVAVNNLGVLHLVENGDSVQSFEDLKGKTVYLTGKGTTPEYALRYLLAVSGIEEEVTLEFKSEATEVVAALSSDVAALGILPEPFVTSALMQNENLSCALDLNEVWKNMSGDSALVTGVCVAREETLSAQPEAVKAFLAEFKESLNYSNAEPQAVAEKIAEMGIVGKAAVAEKALPGCNLQYMDGKEMQTVVSGYLKTLYDQNPTAVGGVLPDDNFWYMYE